MTVEVHVVGFAEDRDAVLNTGPKESRKLITIWEVPAMLLTVRPVEALISEQFGAVFRVYARVVGAGVNE